MTEEQDVKSDEPVVAPSLQAELDAGVEKAMATIAEESKAIEAEVEAGIIAETDLPPKDESEGDDEEAGGESPAPDEDDDATEDDEEASDGDEDPVEDDVSDELFERAVRAGLSKAEVEEISSGTLLAKICDRMESAAADADDVDAEDSGGKDGEEDLFATIPDLDPDVYDENVVDAVGALKDIVRKQHELIRGLQDAGVKDGEKSWFESKVSGLGKAFGKALKGAPQKQEELKVQFDVLSAGYKAAGKELSQDDIFDQAVSLALGEIKESITEASKEKKLRGRRGQFIARPGSSSGSKPGSDVYDDTAAELDRVFFEKA